MWEWFHEKKATTLDFNKKKDASIEVFEMFFYTEERYEWPRNYYELNLLQLWDVTWSIFMMASGIGNDFKIDVKYTLNEIELELDKVFRALLWWCFAEDLTDADFSTFDYTMVDREKMSVNQHFRYRIYYIVKSMEKSFQSLRTQMTNLKNKEVNNMEIISEFDFKNNQSQKIVYEFITNEIRKSAAGDADEFILYTIANIQNRTMSDNHEKLCQLIRFIKFEDPDFITKLPPGQIWQTLFKDVFDGKDEVFDVFYKAFTSEAILYFLSDYALNTFGIEQIPWYNVFTDNRGQSYSNSILNLLDSNQISKRIRQVIKKYEAS